MVADLSRGPVRGSLVPGLDYLCAPIRSGPALSGDHPGRLLPVHAFPVQLVMVLVCSLSALVCAPRAFGAWCLVGSLCKCWGGSGVFGTLKGLGTDCPSLMVLVWPRGVELLVRPPSSFILSSVLLLSRIFRLSAVGVNVSILD